MAERRVEERQRGDRSARLGALIGSVALALTLVACGEAPADPQLGVSASGPATPELTSTEHHFTEVARYGSGRAVQADATATTTVIATTIGVAVHRYGTVAEVPTSLPAPLDDVLVAPDGASVLLVASSGTSELWSLGDEPELLGSFDDTMVTRFTGDGGAVDLVRAGVVERVSTVSGSVIDRAVVPDVPADSDPVVAWVGPDGRVVALSNDPARAAGWVWRGGADVAAIEVDAGGSVTRAVGDPTDARVLLGTRTEQRAGTLEAVDVGTGSVEWTRDVDDVAGSRWDVGHDGRVLVVSGMATQLLGRDGEVQTTWPLDGGESVVAVRSLAPAPGFVIVRARGSIIFVDADGERAADVPTAGLMLVDVEPVGDSGGVVAVDYNGTVRQWGPTAVAGAEVTNYVAGTINEVAVSADGTTAAAASSDGNVRLLDLVGATGTVVGSQNLFHPEGSVDSVTFTPDGLSVVSGISEPNGRNTFDDSMIRWDLASAERGFTVAGIPQPIMGCTDFFNTVRVAPDGSYFVAPFHDFTVSVRSMDDGSVIHEFPPHISIVWGVAIAPDGSHLATSSDDWTVRVWDLETYELRAEYDVAPGGFLAIDYLPDGKRLVVSDITGTVRILDLEDGALSAPFEGEKLHEGRLSVSPDGRYAAAGSIDVGHIIVWDTTTGSIVADLAGHTGAVDAVVFTPDGRGLLSGSSDGTVRLWQLT